jgi:hypothetical protein
MVTSLIAKGKDQGYLLSDDIVAAFPNAEDQLDHLEEFYTSLVAEGIEVVDQAPAPVKVVAKSREIAVPPSERPLDRATERLVERAAAHDDYSRASAIPSGSISKRSARPTC